MALDLLSEEKVIAWLTSKCPKLVCQACGQKQWSVQGVSVAGAVEGHKPLEPIHLSFGMPLFAKVNVMCDNCGMLVGFSARRLGLVE